MFRRRFEQVAVMLLSITMLLTSTGIVSSLAYDVSESSAAPSTSSTQTETSTSTVVQEGGEISTPSVEQEGGAIVVIDEGNGTKESPYKISTVEQFLSIGGKVNNTASADKYFVLTADIDLSGISGNDFAKNGGSLIGIDKTLASAGGNVFIIFDGNGHSLKGLNVEITSGDEASIFGVINEKSAVRNLKIEKPVVKSTSAQMSDIALVATENRGVISAVTVSHPVLSATKAQNAAFIAAENYGTVSDVTVRGSHTNISAASAENHTISATGNAGAVAGLNRGTVTNASAINVGMFIPESESAVVYGGIAGANSGSVLNSVSSGNVVGGKSADSAGGIVGKAVKGSGAEATSTLTNNYSLVSFSGAVSACGVIGSDGTDEMIKDCYWSGDVSKKDTAAGDFGCGVNELSSRGFIIIPEGKKAVLSANDVKASKWGKATFELDGAFTVKGEGIEYENTDTAVSVTAKAANKAAYATYYAKIMLPANVGSSAGNTLKQYFRVDLLTVAADAKGDGSSANPFVVKTANDFNLLRYAPEMNIVLANDISVNSYVSSIKGTVDGKGFTINTAKPLAKAVYGTVKNVNVIVTSDITTAVFGNAVNAKISNVRVAMAEDIALRASANGTGILFNRIGDGTVIDSAQVKGDIVITADKTSAVGTLAGIIDGDNVTVTHSGAVADITAADGVNGVDTAIFAGKISGEKVSVADSYVGGANFAGEYAFLGNVSAKDLKVKAITTSLSSAEGAAQKLASFNGFDKNQFSAWKFDDGNAAFFTGNGGTFTATLPAVKVFAQSTAADYTVICDASKLISSVNVADGKLSLTVQRAQGVVTVKSIPVTVVNTKTGLSATINVSNGLEKDANGRYVITSAYDLAYVSENIAELSTADFIMKSDVDMSVLDSFAPIGTAEAVFSGTFDGNGKTISGLTLSGNAKSGLFSALDSATVKNIRFVNADITSAGGYAGVLAGQVTGNTTLSGITVESAKVTTTDLYAGVIFGSADGTDNTVSVSDITVKNSAISSQSSYVGALAGRINANAKLDKITVDGFSAEGANYIAGVAGLAQGEVAMSDISVNEAKLSGVSEVSGVTSGKASVKNVTVKNSEISTVAISSAYTAGGISAVLSGEIENATVENTKITAGISAGIVAKTSADGSLTLSGVNVKACTVNSAEANTVAAGVLGVHNVKGTVTVNGAVVDAQTVVEGGAVSAGIVGDCSGADSILSITDSKSLATVNGSQTENAVSAAGVLGRVGISAVNNITISEVNAGGKVSGNGALGGIIGIVRAGNVFTASAPIVSDCVVFTQIDSENADSSALIVGMIEGEVITSANVASAVRGVVLSTFGGVNAYPSAELSGGYTDMNSGITPSVSTLSTFDETIVEISGLPQVEGFVFDAETGWISESEDRISVVSSDENSAVLKANRRADISVIAYYVLDSDSDVRIPVEFRVSANVPEPLEGRGTAALPYLIYDAYDLEAMVSYADKNAYFALAEDIVLTQADYEFGGAFYNVGNGIVTIGNAEVAFNGNFTGLYDGKIHSITGLRTQGNTLGGLFGATDGAVISDLIINDAHISASANVGVLVGRASDTTIKNVTVSSAEVMTTQAGSVAGGIVGVADSTIIEDVTLNCVSVSTTLDSTSATVETAGGVAGIYDGLVRNATLKEVSVVSATVAGGVIGSVNADPANIVNVYADVDVNAQFAGGVAGRTDSPKQLSTNGVTVCGKVYGTDVSAGVVAQIKSDSAADEFIRLTRSFATKTVVAAKITGEDVLAVVVGEVSEAVATDNENSSIDVFSDVYYSSYQNPMGAFGSEQFNAYSNTEYTINDLSSLSYRADGTLNDTIELDTEFAPLLENSIVLNNADGTYKSFTAGETVFTLEDITSDAEGLVEYNAQKSAVRLTSPVTDSANLVFVYSGGLEIAIPITSEYALQGSGTKENPYLISTADDFGFMLNNSNEGKYYALTQDISLAGVAGGTDFAGNLNGNGFVLYDYTGTSLFGRMSGTLTDIGFVGFDVSDSQADSVGAVAAAIDGGRVESCFVIAQVKADGSKQDAGILAGRAVNGAVIADCVTSGKVEADKSLATGGVIGMASDAEILRCTSTAYVLAGNTAGGIVGEASYSKIDSVIFANMVESDGKSGNLAGILDDMTVLANGYYDSSTARDEVFADCDTDESSLVRLATEDLVAEKIDGFVSLGGYPVPEALADGGSAKFVTGVEFSAMTIRFVAGLSAGTAYNYTDIVADSEVNSNEVLLDKTSGVKLTLTSSADYADAKNEIVRYMNPVSSSAVQVSCAVAVAENSDLSDELLGVMLKTKSGEDASSFDFFTTAASQPKSLAAVTVADGGLYVNMHLPEGYTFDVVAVNEKSETLTTQDAANEGVIVNTDGSERISLTLTLRSEAEQWGMRSIWSAIGK